MSASAARAFGLGLALLAAVPAGVLAGGAVHVARVSGGINPAVADYLHDAILQSEAEGAAALVVELDTPGGLLASTKDIVTDILNAGVPVVVYVSPRGAWAASAGTFITLAGHVAAMAPGTSIGSAHPVSIGGGQPEPAGEEGKEGEKKPPRDVEAEKIENFTAAFVESIAEARDRNVKWAIEAVRNSVAITQSQALEKKVIDLVAEDLDELLEQIDGRKVRVRRAEVVLQTAGARIERIEMALVNAIFNVIANPQVAWLLFLAGLLGLYVELNHPGLVFPAVTGAVCLVLAGLSFQLIPFNWIGLILVLTGIALLVAEIFVASFGLLLVSGLACFAAGGALLFDVPAESDLSLPFWSGVFPAVLVVGGFAALVVFGVSRTLRREMFSGREALIGRIAVADGPIEGHGRVYLSGEYWNAVSDEPVPDGDSVEILEVRDLLLRVRPARRSQGERG